MYRRYVHRRTKKAGPFDVTLQVLAVWATARSNGQGHSYFSSQNIHRGITAPKFLRYRMPGTTRCYHLPNTSVVIKAPGPPPSHRCAPVWRYRLNNAKGDLFPEANGSHACSRKTHGLAVDHRDGLCCGVYPRRRKEALMQLKTADTIFVLMAIGTGSIA
jgi:hypothetical protein